MRATHCATSFHQSCRPGAGGVVGLSLSRHTSACVPTAALYAEVSRRRVIIVSKQNKERKR